MVNLIGKQAPIFTLKAIMPNKSVGNVALEPIKSAGKWTVLFFYPMDFTEVCPTEITAFSDRYDEFIDLNTEIIGVSKDTVETHLKWINTDRFHNGVGQLAYPLAEDVQGELAQLYRVYNEQEQLALRALFIISPDGELQYESVFHYNIGRDIDEILRVLQALQTGGLCPANWRPGDALL